MANAKNTIIDRKPFDIQEAVILLDVYLLEKSNHLKRTEAAKIASVRLRDLAAKRRMMVSDSYRSPMGLQNRLRSIGGIFEGKESVSAPGTEAFREAVALFKNDVQRYQNILENVEDSLPQRQECKSDKARPKVKEVHTKYVNTPKDQMLQDKHPRTFSEVYYALKCLSEKNDKGVTVTDVFLELEQRIIHKEIIDILCGASWSKVLTSGHYIFYDKEQEERNARLMDEEMQENGYFSWLSSVVPPHVLEGIKNSYNVVSAMLVQKKVLSQPLVATTQINQIENALNQIKRIIGSKKLRNNASKLLSSYLVYLRELKNTQPVNANSSLVDVQEKGTLIEFKKVSAKRESTAVKKNVGLRFDMIKTERILMEIGLQGATVQELIDAVQPGAAFLPTKNALDENLNVIAMPDNHYIHVDAFVDLDEAKEGIGRILRTQFAQFGGYSNNQLLFGAASQELSMFLNDNDCDNIDAVYAIARYLFEKKASANKPYKFYPPHIFEIEPDYPMNLRGLMINLARSNGGILYTVDAKTYLQKTKLTYGGIGQLLQIGTANTFLMYDDDRYLLSETIGIDDEWCHRMHDQMDDLFRKANVAYIIPRDISTTWLSTLPTLPQSLAWTRLFLQEILNKYPTIGFKSISADVIQSHHTLSAAFVPIDSPLQSFPDVVTLFMEEKYELPRRMLGEELRIDLRNAGMLENDELIYALPKALDDYRFAWTDENKYVYVRGN